MAPTFLTAVVVLVSQVLPLVGIHIAGADLTTTVNTVIAIVGGLIILYRQWSSGRSTLAGTRPYGFVN